jgi:hypothetical protein
MLYMIVERFKDGDAVPVYRRFRERGRLAPEGPTYGTAMPSSVVHRVA